MRMTVASYGYESIVDHCRNCVLIYYYVLLARVVSYVTSSNRSGWLQPPMSGVTMSRLTVTCVSWFGAPSLSWHASLMCINSRCLLDIMCTVNDTTLCT